MTYEETINYLYESAPLFQNIGANAYKEGLYNTYVLDEHFEHPHTKYKTIHIAGTNGKGSCAHARSRTSIMRIQNRAIYVTSPC